MHRSEADKKEMKEHETEAEKLNAKKETESRKEKKTKSEITYFTCREKKQKGAKNVAIFCQSMRQTFETSLTFLLPFSFFPLNNYYLKKEQKPIRKRYGFLTHSIYR